MYMHLRHIMQQLYMHLHSTNMYAHIYICIYAYINTSCIYTCIDTHTHISIDTYIDTLDLNCNSIRTM